MFNQVPSQSKDVDEKPTTAVLKPLESVKLSFDCQPRVALLPTKSITKGFRHLSQMKSPTVSQTRGIVVSLVLEVEHLLGVPKQDNDLPLGLMALQYLVFGILSDSSFGISVEILL